MKTKLLGLFVAATSIFVVSLTMFAHHGATQYDTTNIATLKGTVTEFDFMNPHVKIYLDRKNEKGEIEKWQIECDSPTMLTRGGWNRNTLKVGDKVTISGKLARSGAKAMRLQKVDTPDGHEFYDEGEQPPK